MGYQCCVCRKPLDEKIFSDSYQIIKVEVGSEWLVGIECCSVHILLACGDFL